MQNITFDSLPSAVTAILEKVNNIELLLAANASDDVPINSGDKWLSVEELISYLPGTPSKATIYGKVHKRLIPHKKFGSKLAFLKSEIDEYLQSLHRKTAAEIENDATLYFKKRKNEK